MPARLHASGRLPKHAHPARVPIWLVRYLIELSVQGPFWLTMVWLQSHYDLKAKHKKQPTQAKTWNSSKIRCVQVLSRLDLSWQGSNGLYVHWTLEFTMPAHAPFKTLAGSQTYLNYFPLAVP